MKFIINLVGVIFVVAGVVVLSYQGVEYSKQAENTKLWHSEFTTEIHDHIFAASRVGALSVVAGLILLVIGRGRRR